MYPVVCTSLGALFADKVDALARKNRARHLYDIIFMLSQDHPIDRDVLDALGLKADPLSLIAEKVKSLSVVDLKKLAEELRPFLFDENEACLIINAHTIIPQLIGRYHPKDIIGPPHYIAEQTVCSLLYQPSEISGILKFSFFMKRKEYSFC